MMKIEMQSVCLRILLVAVALTGTNANEQVPKVTSGPVDLRNAGNTEVILTCAVDIVNDTVAWHYNGMEKFMCDFPYAVGTCMEEDNYTGDVDTDRNVITLRFLATGDGIGGNWTCNTGGNTSEPFVVDAGNSPQTALTLSNYNSSGGGDVTLTCSAMSDVKLDYLAMVQVRPQENLLTESNPMNMTYEKTIPVPCTDNMVTCCVTNKYGHSCDSVTIETSCKFEIKENTTILEMEVEAKDDDKFASLRLFFTGEPIPQYTWYREDNGTESLLTRYRTEQTTNATCNAENMPCIILRILKPIKADSGNYTIRVVEATSRLNDSYTFRLKVTEAEPKVVPPEVGCEPLPELSFGQGMGAGIGIGICSVFFVAGVIYGFRDS